MTCRFRALAAAFGLSLLTMAPALAEPCKTIPSAKGAEVKLSQPMSETDRLGLSAAVLLALSDPSGKAVWPDDVVERARPCPLGEFQAADAPWTLGGGDGRVPPRLVQSATSEDYLFLALGPGTAEAYEWFRKGADGPLTVRRPTFLLVEASGAVRVVYRAYDGVPSDADLTADATSVIEGRTRPLAIFDIQGQAVTVAGDTQSGVQAQLFAPEDHSATIYGPDGKYFTAAQGDAARMRGSGFICPGSLGQLSRTRMMVLRGMERGLDLGCSFDGGETWITLFVTDKGEEPFGKGAFEAMLGSERKAGGVSRKLSAETEGMAFGETWMDRKGAGQGVWVTRRGPYVIEARATFAPQDEAPVRRAIAAIATAAAEVPER